jgi:hypothetical protein
VARFVQMAGEYPAFYMFRSCSQVWAASHQAQFGMQAAQQSLPVSWSKRWPGAKMIQQQRLTLAGVVKGQRWTHGRTIRFLSRCSS